MGQIISCVQEAMAKNSEYMGKDESNKRHKIVFSGDNDLEEFEAAGKRPKPENRFVIRGYFIISFLSIVFPR